MTHQTGSEKKSQIPNIKASKRQAQEQRRDRLAAELRANLRKRKEQARGRAQQEAPAPGEAGATETGRTQGG